MERRAAGPLAGSSQLPSPIKRSRQPQLSKAMSSSQSSSVYLVLSEYLQYPPVSWRLVNKDFKAAVDEVRSKRGFPHTWHLHAGSLNSQLNDMLSVMASDQYEFVKSVRLNGSGVLMSEEDCQLLVAALGAKAWESVSLLEVSPVLFGITEFVSCCPQALSFGFKGESREGAL
jgi:hypothetical protein